MSVNLRISVFIMASYSCPDTSTAPYSSPLLNRRCGVLGCFLLEGIIGVENLCPFEALESIRRPLRIFVFIVKPLEFFVAFDYVMSKTPSNPLLMEDHSCRLSVLTTEEHGMLQKIEQFLPQELVTVLARQSGAIQRLRKVIPMSLLGALCLLALHESCSLRLVAMFTGILGGCVLSKQALAQRINEAWSQLYCKILGCTLAKTARQVEAERTGIFSHFKRVLVNDSTSIALFQKLASYFPGSGNQSKKHNAMMKLQATLDLLSETFVDFSITGVDSSWGTEKL